MSTTPWIPITPGNITPTKEQAEAGIWLWHELPVRGFAEFVRYRPDCWDAFAHRSTPVTHWKPADIPSAPPALTPTPEEVDEAAWKQIEGAEAQKYYVGHHHDLYVRGRKDMRGYALARLREFLAVCYPAPGHVKTPAMRGAWNRLVRSLEADNLTDQ